MPGPDPKPPKRIKDPEALRRARLAETMCAACGGRPGSIHHIIPRGEGGDDIYPGNLLALCGSGTTGCHGSLHGNAYTVELGRGIARIAPQSLPMRDSPAFYIERRDAEWVARKVGVRIAASPPILAYMNQKLGESRAREYLARRYYIEATCSTS